MMRFGQLLLASMTAVGVMLLAIAPSVARPDYGRSITVIVSTIVHPLAQRRIGPAAKPATSPWPTTRIGAHRIYGTIAALAGSQLTVRLRSGRIQLVDASSAVANGNYSAPLFVGKLVSIDGEFIGSKFVAAHIDRLTNLGGLGDDR